MSRSTRTSARRGAGQGLDVGGRPLSVTATVCLMEEVEASIAPPHGAGPAAGAKLGGYTVVREIGSGAMGAQRQNRRYALR